MSRLLLNSIVLIFLLPLPPATHAILADVELEGKSVTAIWVNARSFTSRDVMRMTGLRIGMPFSPRAVQNTLQPLYQTGLFTDIRIEVEPNPEGVEIRYSFTEKTFISKVQVSGHTFSTKKILNALNLREGDEFSTEAWKSALTRLFNFYQRQGYFQPQIEMNAMRLARQNTVDLNIQIDQGSRVKMRKVTFAGNKVLPEVLLYFTLGIAEGFYNADKIDKGLKKLERLYEKRGYIEARIGPPELTYHEAPQEVSIAIPIDAGIRVQVHFEGSFEKKTFFWRRPLEAQLLIREQRSIEPNILEESRERLARYFKDQGHLFASVSYRIEEHPEEQRVEITFRIDAGPQVLLMSIEFEGNANLRSREIRKSIRTKSTGILIPRYVNEDFIKADEKAILALYQSKGFLKAQVKSQLQFAPERDRTDLTFQIVEGVQTFIDEIEFRGNVTFTDPELLKVSGLESQIPFDYGRAREAEFKILSHYSKRGYAYTQVKLNERFKEDGRMVDLIYAIEEDQPAFIGKTFLQGNTFTQDHVIMRELLIGPNDPYDEEKIRISIQRLYKLGFLSEVRLTPISEQKEYVRDLLLSVKERKAGAIEFGLGYGEEERIRGFAEVSHRNLFGTGRRLSLRGELSSIEKRYTLTYKEPWLLSLPMDARAGLTYQVEEFETFDRRTLGGTVGIDKSFSELTKGSIQYQFEQNKCEDIEDVAVLIGDDLQRVTVGSIVPSLIRDSRDDPFNPTTGSVNGIIIKDSAKVLGSEVQFVKTTLQSSWYQSLGSWVVVAVSGRAGLAQTFGETDAIHCSERFFLGGRSTIRGYARDTVGIPGQTLISLRPTGGNAMLLFNAELRLRLPKRIGLVLFIDGGNVWLEYRDIQASDLKYSAGAGLRYNTPIGPLRLDMGFKLDREIGETRSELHFTLGHTF